MNRFRKIWTQAWRPLLGASIGILTISLLYIYRLGSLTQGVNATESAVYDQVSKDAVTPTLLLRDSLYLPHDIAHYVLQFLPFHKAGSIRLASVIIAMLAIASFFYIIKTWHSRRLAIMATALFACSTWLLHLGRYGGNDILYTLPLLFIAAFTWQQKHADSRIGWLAMSVLTASCLYVPGLVWLILPCALWQRKRIARMLRTSRIDMAIIGGVLGILLCIPLALTIAWPAFSIPIGHSLAFALGLPTAIAPDALLDNAKNLFRILFWRGSDPVLTVGALPLLDVFTSTMIIIGAWIYIRDYKLDRAKWILAYTAIGLALTILGGVTISILLPVMYILAAEGLAYMLISWLSVFPLNPVARSIGLGVISVSVAIVACYHLIAYFVAWPHIEATQTTFNRQL